MITLRPFEQERLDHLIELARNHFDPAVNPAEVRVLAHSATAYDLPLPPQNEHRPPVRPEFLRWLMTDSTAAEFIDRKGIRIWSVSILTALDLQGCSIPHSIHFLSTTFEAELILSTANVNALYVFRGTLRKGLLADGISIHGPAFIKETKSDGMIHLIGATVDGNVDLTGTELTGNGITLALDGARIRGSAFLRNGFRSSGEVRMLNARIGGDLGFDGATLTETGRALSLDKVSVEGIVSIGDGFHSDGSVNMPAAEIRGDLNCNGADLAARGIALNLATAKIGGHVYLRKDFKARGQLQMHSVEIGNSIDLSGATLSDAASAISLEEAKIRGSVFICDGFTASGRIDLPSAQVGGNLVCDDCKFAALYCANMTLKGDLQWTAIHEAKSTSLWLNGASIKSLRDERESWPSLGALHLDGLLYEELTLHSARTEKERQSNSLGPEHALKVEERIKWLQLQPLSDQSEPQPWMQLADLLKAKGNDGGAKRVTFELQRVQAKHLNKAMYVWRIGFARLQQQPLWILAPIFLITLLASCLFWLANARGSMAPTNKEAYVAWSTGSRDDAAYPRFNPVIYSLENDLPLVRLGVDDKWAPNQRSNQKNWLVSYTTLSWARVFLILSGWFQATVLAAAIGSRFKG